ncbi:MAG: hypothetical protein AM326_03140 [Candidatus Thorarchaeota archaeon SMTZ-45]|nr:MAG: hypothetical protein AM326_03140 [Candidatus Thorarchaeota archaeon SMTZ-45]
MSPIRLEVLEVHYYRCKCCGLFFTAHWSGVCESCQSMFETHEDFLIWFCKHVHDCGRCWCCEEYTPERMIACQMRGE